MAILMKVYYQDGIEKTAEYLLINQDATTLLRYLNEDEVLQRINVANSPGAPSQRIQNIFLRKALELGFKDEKQGLFRNYLVSALRPDYYKPIKDTGILIEVERGKTIQNNMDMLDLWKCHICNNADYLFLIVPRKLKQNDHTSNPYKVYDMVCNRLESFFVKGNYVNVKALFIFGY